VSEHRSPLRYSTGLADTLGRTTTIAVGRIRYDWSVKRDDILVERYRSIALAMLAARELAARCWIPSREHEASRPGQKWKREGSTALTR
jgi:hypothetical protein